LPLRPPSGEFDFSPGIPASGAHFSKIVKVVVSTTERGIPWKDEAMNEEQRASDMATEVLRREESARAAKRLKDTPESAEDQQIGDSVDVSAREEQALQQQQDLAREREQARERSRVRKEEAEHEAWELFMRDELRELELRKNGQLARLLGEPLQGELPTQLRELAAEDQRQAQEGLVALMSGGKTSYKRLEDFTPEDLPARTAANRLRTAWLKERGDGWLGNTVRRS